MLFTFLSILSSSSLICIFAAGIDIREQRFGYINCMIHLIWKASFYFINPGNCLNNLIHVADISLSQNNKLFHSLIFLYDQKFAFFLLVIKWFSKKKSHTLFFAEIGILENQKYLNGSIIKL